MSDNLVVGRRVFSIEKPPAPDALDAIRARIDGLYAGLRRDRERVRAHDLALEALRGEARGLRAALIRPPAPFSPARISAPAPAAPSRPHWIKALPYAALAAVGLCWGARTARPPAAAKPVPSHLALAAAPEPERPAENEGPALALTEEEAMDEAISLVYAYRPAGSRRTVQEILWPEIEASADASPWVVAPAGGSTYLVTFRPYGEALDGRAPLYEFEVDLEAETVAASPETLQSLGGQTLALARATRP